jgi:hypothetical protein
MKVERVKVTDAKGKLVETINRLSPETDFDVDRLNAALLVPDGLEKLAASYSKKPVVD